MVTICHPPILGIQSPASAAYSGLGATLPSNKIGSFVNLTSDSIKALLLGGNAKLFILSIGITPVGPFEINYIYTFNFFTTELFNTLFSAFLNAFAILPT